MQRAFRWAGRCFVEKITELGWGSPAEARGLVGFSQPLVVLPVSPEPVEGRRQRGCEQERREHGSRFDRLPSNADQLLTRAADVVQLQRALRVLEEEPVARPFDSRANGRGSFRGQVGPLLEPRQDTGPFDGEVSMNRRPARGELPVMSASQ